MSSDPDTRLTGRSRPLVPRTGTAADETGELAATRVYGPALLDRLRGHGQRGATVQRTNEPATRTLHSGRRGAEAPAQGALARLASRWGAYATYLGTAGLGALATALLTAPPGAPGPAASADPADLPQASPPPAAAQQATPLAEGDGALAVSDAGLARITSATATAPGHAAHQPADAAAALCQGNRRAAREHYAALARLHPQQPVYATLVRLLETDP